MRVKLRLYARDLDLIALKHNRYFQFNNELKKALVEYVGKGECTKIHVPADTLDNFVLQNEEVNISLNEEKHGDVINWLLNIKEGLRSYAIKAVFRSAIASPDLSLFTKEGFSIITTTKAIPESQPAISTGSGFIQNNPDTSPQSRPTPAKESEPNFSTTNETSDYEFNLFADEEFFENY